MAWLWRPLRVAGEAEGEKPGTPGKDSKPGNPLLPGGWSPLLNPGWKLELKADAKPGKTGDDDGIPAAAAAAAAAACSGATDATEDEEAPASPMNEDNTGLPAPCPPETPNPGKAAGLAPGGRPGNIEAAEVRPRPNGEAPPGPPLGARPAYMEVGGWVDMLVVGGMDEGMEEAGREDVREEKGDRPG